MSPVDGSDVSLVAFEETTTVRRDEGVRPDDGAGQSAIEVLVETTVRDDAAAADDDGAGQSAIEVLVETTVRDDAAADDDDDDEEEEEVAATEEEEYDENVDDDDDDEEEEEVAAAAAVTRERHVSVETRPPSTTFAVDNKKKKKKNNNGRGGWSTSGGGGVKRKSTCAVGLLDFVKTLHRAVRDVAPTFGAFTEDALDRYVAELTCTGRDGKKSKSSTAGGGGGQRHTADVVDPKRIRLIYKRVMVSLFVALERANASLQFSREQLKYFMATHRGMVSVNSFADTNRLRPKQRTVSRLCNGAILAEYAKSKYMFASNLSRCHQDDVEAVRYIVENDMCLSRSLYSGLFQCLDDVQYVVDKVDTPRADHVSVPIMNSKRAALMIRESTVLIYDGNQFVLPTPSVERDVTATMVSGAKLKKNEYIVLDVLLSSKLKVIDVIETNIAGLRVPPLYADRLDMLAGLFRDIKCVTPTTKGDGGCSRLHKSVNGHTEPVHVYYKPNHTLAAVGVQNTSVLVAYEDDNGDLVYKLNTVNSGPASLALGAVELQEPGATTICVTNGGGQKKVVRVLGLENVTDARLFTSAVRAEWKDGNKLGCLSRSPFTNVSEYKPLQVQRDGHGATALTVANLNLFMNDPNNLDCLIKAISKSTQFDTIIRHLQQNDSAYNVGSVVDMGY